MKKLTRWYNWLEKNQKGPIANSFRWRGRTENHTLTSGLDDYPRIKIPSENEMHLDLACWMSKMALILSDISTKLDKSDDEKYWSKKHLDIYKMIEDFHWDGDSNMFYDLEYNSGSREFARHFGYINLFPLLLELVPHDSPKLLEILKLIKDPKQIWSKFGLRSLSLKDPYFGKGEDYWRGAIWININYLALRALGKKYAVLDGPYKAFAKEIYNELRENLIDNMFYNFKKTGSIWEQYHPTSGKGQRSRPFTGWSALVVLVMAEIY